MLKISIKHYIPMLKIQSWSRWFLFLAIALTPSRAFGNTGIFEGSGHTIKLIRSEDVEMQSEEVTIVPGRGPFLFNGSAMDRVEYSCKFVLHNRSKKPVTIQVGFPLTSQFMKPPYHPEKTDPTDVVLRYKFIARDKDKTYHVRFEPYDKDKKLASIFLWDMSFQGDEVCKLNIAYEIPMAMGLSSMDDDWDAHYPKAWYSRLTPCIYEGFDYVTVTGQSWAGPIHNAKFNLHIAGFEQYLASRCIIEERVLTAEERAAIEKTNKENAARIEEEIKNGEIKGNPAEFRDLLSNDAWKSLLDWHIKDCMIRRQVGPDGWQEKDGLITWEFKNYRPKEPIRVSYFLSILPKTPNGVPSFVRLVLGNKPSKEDLSDLREIFLAWWGIAPKSESVLQFVSKQRWYSPKDGMKADKLTTEKKAVISAIEQYSPNPQSSSK
jgi:hypothetical protein